MPAKKTPTKKAALKTVPTGASVKAHLDSVKDGTLRRDARAVAKLLETESGAKPAMWGDAIVGFGTFEYRYASGRHAEWPRVGFAVRKSGLVLYMAPGYEEEAALLAKLGPHSIGKSCLYVKSYEDLDEKVLRQLVRRSLVRLERMFPG